MNSRKASNKNINLNSKIQTLIIQPKNILDESNSYINTITIEENSNSIQEIQEIKPADPLLNRKNIP